ncbi:hypothetical protein Tco_0484033 [Tanacetum coccineum]
MKSPVTPNPKRQLPGQSREGGMGASTPEARHQSLVSSGDSNQTTSTTMLWSSEGRREVVLFNRLGRKEPDAFTRSDCHHPSSQAKGTEVLARKHHHEGTSSRRTNGYSESEDSERGHWKSKSKRHRTRMPSHVKTYDGSGGGIGGPYKLFSPEQDRDMGNANVVSHDPVEIHHIKQRDGESTEDFMERYKEEVLDVEGAPECMKISGFMHGITHPELIKRLYEKIPRSMDEMYRETTSFLQEEVAAFSHGRKKEPTQWKQPEEGNKLSFKKGFKNKHRFRPEIRSQMVPPTTYLTEFSGETIWPLGQISLLVKIGRPGIRKIRAIPSTTHGMLKFPVEGGMITLQSSRIIPMECAMISGPSTWPPEVGKILEEKIGVAIHPEYPE